MSSVARVLGAAALTVLVTVPPAGAAVPSSTVVAVQGSAGPVLVGYGQPVAALGQVSVPGAVPDGWVYVVVDGVSRRADLAADGTASATVEGLGTGTHSVSATFVPRDPAQQEGSTSAAVTVEVAKVVASATIRVSGRRDDRVTGIRVRATTPYGTEPTGKVTVVVRRLGTSAKRTRRAVLEGGVAGLTVGPLPRGKHRVVVEYGGDRNTEPFREIRDFRVRRR